MDASERLKYVFIWGLIDAVVCFLLVIPWTLASLVAYTRSRPLYDSVIHYPLVSTSISALPSGSVGMFPNYSIVAIVLILLFALTTSIVHSQWNTFKIEREERIKEGVRRNRR